MTTDTTSPQITLVVSNPGLLMHGCTPMHQFDRAGGTLGSLGADWQLTDRARRIHPVHCEIRWREGGFCVIDRSGETYMNGNDLSLEPGTSTRLNPGDSLQIGDYRITAHPHADRVDGSTRHLSQHSMAELLNGGECPLQYLSRPITEIEPVPTDAIVHSKLFEQLSAPPAPYQECDPLQALDAATRTHLAQEIP